MNLGKWCIDTLFFSHPDPILLYSQNDKCILEVNDAAVKRYGFTRTEFLSMTMADIEIANERIVRVRDVALLTSGLETSNIRRHCCKSGEMIYVDVRASQLDFNGKDAELIIARDVSSLVQSDASLRMAIRLFEIGMWRLDFQSEQLFCCESTCRILGLDKVAESISVDTYFNLIHPDDQSFQRRSLAKFRESNDSVYVFEHRMVRPDGKIIVVRGGAERFMHKDRFGLSGVLQDVTDIVSIDQKSKELDDALHMNRKASRVGTWRIDIGSNFVSWSPETAAIHELPGTFSLSTQEALEFFLPKYRVIIKNRIMKCRSDGVSFDENLQMRTAKGHTIWVRSVGEVLRSSSGEICAVQGSFQDISELVQAQKSADRYAQRLATTLENISDAFALLDNRWRIVFVNRRSEELLSQKRDNVIGKLLWEVFPNAMGSSFESKLRDSMSAGSAMYTVEYVSALELWLEINAYPSSEGMSMYLRDVTSERMLTSQLNLLETAVSRMNDVLIITKADTLDEPEGPEIVYVNDAFERVTGFSREDAIGKTPRFLQGENTQRAELLRIREALVSKKSVYAELISYRKDGAQIELEIDIVPIVNKQGRCTHFVAVERDLTQRKNLEKAVRENDERMRVFSDATTDVIWDWNLQNDSLWWSKSVESTFGYRPDAFETGVEFWTNRIHPEDRERVSTNLNAALEGNSVVWTEEYKFMHADGSYRIVNDRACIVRDENGKATRIVGCIVDFTERRELDSQLAQAQKMEAIGQLTGGVAHDFNNLLTVILGNAEMLIDKSGGDRQLRMMAEMVTKAAESGAELTNRLLAFARKQPLEPSIVDVNKLIAQMDPLFKHTVRENIEIEFVQGAGLWAAELDGSQLSAALLNLVINSRDAMPNGGRLTIETANTALDEDYATKHLDVEAGHYVRVSVSDCGIGMNAEAIKRAFEPFFSTKPVGKGSGLGLSMVYGFVKQSRGHASIYSEVGEGTVVKLYFPRVERAVIGQGYEIESNELVGGTELILVVEDDDLVRQHLSTQLKYLGYRVLNASNGPKALTIIAEHPEIDLLFTDVVMPGGMNGRELADKAKVLRPNLKVLFTSGYTENAIVHQGRLDAGVELLHKPYRRQQMSVKVRKVLDRGP